MKFSKLVLHKILNGYSEQGFSLLQEDDHFLTLYFKDERVAVFNCSVTQIPYIRMECKRYLEELQSIENEITAKKLCNNGDKRA